MKHSTTIGAGAALTLVLASATAQLPNLGADTVTSIGGSVSGSVAGIPDATLRGQLQGTLQQELHLSGVRSDVHNGVATLRGTVASEAERNHAARVARRVEGITRVRNDIQVAGGAAAGAAVSTGDTNASVGAAVTAELQAAGAFSNRSVHVEALSDNVVRLTGTVASEAEKQMAGRIAADTAAVVEVRNELRVESE